MGWQQIGGPQEMAANTARLAAAIRVCHEAPDLT
jgi:hypothetical protein